MDDEIQINIKMTSTAQVYKIKVLKSDTIQTLKEKWKNLLVTIKLKMTIQLY